MLTDIKCYKMQLEWNGAAFVKLYEMEPHFVKFLCRLLKQTGNTISLDIFMKCDANSLLMTYACPADNYQIDLLCIRNTVDPGYRMGQNDIIAIPFHLYLFPET